MSTTCSVSFISDDSKQDAATTIAHIKLFIELFKKQKIMTSTLSKILGNTNGCAEQYRCASAIYLMSVLSQCLSIIIYQSISAPGNGKELFDVLNVIDKRYIYQLMYKVHLPGSKTFDPQILVCSFTKQMMTDWLNSYKNICLRSIVNMESLIRKNKVK